jgi:hypothetical protein
MSCKVESCTATATGLDTERVIRVKVQGVCSHTGYEVTLKPTNEGFRDDPEVVAVRLHVEEQEVGGEAMTPFEAECEIEGDPATKVRIDTPEGTKWADVEEA